MMQPSARASLRRSLPILVLAAALAACSGSKQPSAPTAVHPAAARPSAAASVAQAAPGSGSRLAAMSVDQLMNEAQKALKQDRLVAPAGDNAFEYYLEVLKRDPHNRAAQDALRETFPYGAQTVDQTINQKNYPEAQREIDLLAKADPTNYTLTILRSKLDAARKLAAQQQAQQQAQQLAKAQAAAAATARQTAAAASARQAQEQQAPTAEQQKQAEQAAQQQAAAARAAALKQQQAQAAAAAAQNRNRGARIVRQVPPRYPLDAARAGEQGWVDVEFTVNPDGSVGNVHVTNAEPRRVFDRAAVDAVSRWKFKPALINGVPTAVVLQRRVEFRLSGG